MLETIKNLYIKYGWILIIVLGAIAVWCITRPVKEVHTITSTVDSTWKQEFGEYQTKMLETFKKQSAEFTSAYKKTMDVNKDINTITDRQYDKVTGKLVSEKITKVDKSTYDAISTGTSSSTVTINSGSSDTSTTYVTVKGEGQVTTIIKEVTVKEKMRLIGFTIGGYTDGCLDLGPVLNFSPGNSLAPVLKYNIYTFDLLKPNYGLRLLVTP